MAPGESSWLTNAVPRWHAAVPVAPCWSTLTNISVLPASQASPAASERRAHGTRTKEMCTWRAQVMFTQRAQEMCTGRAHDVCTGGAQDVCTGGAQGATTKEMCTGRAQRESTRSRSHVRLDRTRNGMVQHKESSKASNRSAKTFQATDNKNAMHARMQGLTTLNSSCDPLLCTTHASHYDSSL